MTYSYRVRPHASAWHWQLLADAVVVSEGRADTSAKARADAFEARLLRDKGQAPTPPIVQ